MNTIKLARFLTIMLIGSLMTPVVFKLLPFPLGSAYFYMAAITGLILVTEPGVFVSKSTLFILLFVILYSIGVTGFWSNRTIGFGEPINIGWIFEMISSVFLAVTLNNYFTKKKDYQGLKIIIITTFILLSITSLHYIFSTILNPELIRGAKQLTDERVKIFGTIGFGYFYGLSFIFPVVGYYLKEKRIVNFPFMLKTLFFLFFILAYISIIQSQFVTAVLTATIFFVAAILWRKELKSNIFLGIITLVVLIFLSPENIKGIFNFLGGFLNDGYLKEKLLDFGTAVSIRDFNPAEGQTYTSKVRLGMLPPLFDSFFSNPLIGGGVTSGHAFWLDQLSMFGMIGVLPWFFIFRNQIKLNLKTIEKELKPYYLMSMFSFFFIGLLKGGMINWQTSLFILFIIPSMSKVKFFKNPNENTFHN